MLISKTTLQYTVRHHHTKHTTMQQRSTIPFFIICILSSFWTIGQPVLVKDINPGFSNGISFGMSSVAGNAFYFTANDGIHGTELWKSDGTSAGTKMVRDINPSTSFSSVDEFLLAYNQQLYFMGIDTAYGTELWRTTDGPEGAILFRDACPGNCSPGSGGMCEFQGKLFFGSYEQASKHEVWVSDGTIAGTQLFKDIELDGSSYPFGFKVYKDKMYFVADSFSKGYEPWITDGTPLGTHLLKDISPGFEGSGVSGFKVASTGLYFFADNVVNGRELWKTDGTSAGTIMVKDIAAGGADGIDPYEYTSNTIELNGNLLFIANSSTTGRELWTTNGTKAGTILVKDIWPGAKNSNIIFLATINGKVLFKAEDGTNGSELWITDGTPSGTTLLKNINAGSADGLNTPPDFAVFQSSMYFMADNGSKGRELWVTDGTTMGTKLLYDIIPGSTGSDPSDFQILGKNLMFFADDAIKGRELWKLDLSSVGTNEPILADLVRISPTLSNDGIFHISLTEQAGSSLSLRVFDVQGREWVNCQITSITTELDLRHLGAGVYFVHALSDGKYQSVQKVVIH